MAQCPTITDQILEVVRLIPDCRLNDLVQICQDFSWQEVFVEVNCLSREGRLHLELKGLGSFAVRLAERESPVRTL